MLEFGVVTPAPFSTNIHTHTHRHLPFDVERVFEILHEVQLRGVFSHQSHDTRCKVQKNVALTSSRRSKPSSLLWLFIVLPCISAFRFSSATRGFGMRIQC